MRNFLAITAVIWVVACYPDYGNTPVEVPGHAFEPVSAVFGMTRYEGGGVWVLENRYDVTWVVLTDVPDACAVFTENARCENSEPAGPPRPNGRMLEISFNSFAEDERTTIGGDRGDLKGHFQYVENGEATLVLRALEGSMGAPRYKHPERVWAGYDFTLDGGTRIQGSFSATRCPAMDEILRKDLYDDEPCT